MKVPVIFLPSPIRIRFPNTDLCGIGSTALFVAMFQIRQPTESAFFIWLSNMNPISCNSITLPVRNMKS
jgi:hypothetical protein